MISWLRYSFFPVIYLRIRYGKSLNSKLFFDVGIPIVLIAVLHISSIVLAKEWPNVSSETLKSILGFLTLSFPFYVASLTAISTFPSNILDEKFIGGENQQATLIKYNADEERYRPEALSRREFMAYMFGYLSFTSLLLLAIIIIDGGFGFSAAIANSFPIASSYVFPVLNFLLWVVLANIFFVTLMALRFLIARVSISHP